MNACTFFAKMCMHSFMMSHHFYFCMQHARKMHAKCVHLHPTLHVHMCNVHVHMHFMHFMNICVWTYMCFMHFMHANARIFLRSFSLHIFACKMRAFCMQMQNARILHLQKMHSKCAFCIQHARALHVAKMQMQMRAFYMQMLAFACAHVHMHVARILCILHKMRANLHAFYAFYEHMCVNIYEFYAFYACKCTHA